jgi:hypothetical protein
MFGGMQLLNSYETSYIQAMKKFTSHVSHYNLFFASDVLYAYLHI